jgi:hypothetical protein
LPAFTAWEFHPPGSYEDFARPYFLSSWASLGATKNGSWDAENTVRAEPVEAWAVFSAFTHWVWYQIPFILRLAQGERILEPRNCRF